MTDVQEPPEDWPEPQDDPEEEPGESLEDDGTPGAVPPKES